MYVCMCVCMYVSRSDRIKVGPPHLHPLFVAPRYALYRIVSLRSGGASAARLPNAINDGRARHTEIMIISSSSSNIINVINGRR